MCAEAFSWSFVFSCKCLVVFPCLFYRHLCVCKECFPHIDKCPVCRSPFDDYVTVQHDRLMSLKAPKCVSRRGFSQRQNGDSEENNGNHWGDNIRHSDVQLADEHKWKSS